MAAARGAHHTTPVRHGDIQDRLFLPGFAKLLVPKQTGFSSAE
jgi:hypothetical protein